MIRNLLNKLACFFGGHPCVPTGRHGIVIHEWLCPRCGGLFVSHNDHGNILVDADERSDQIFKDREAALKLTH